MIIVAFGLVIFIDLRSKGLGAKKRDAYLKELEKIKKRLKAKKIEPDLAIIQGDAFLHKALSTKVSKNLSLGQQLKATKKYFKKALYNDIWEAHKLRNKIVHENISIDEKTANNLLNTFIRGIKAL